MAVRVRSQRLRERFEGELLMADPPLILVVDDEQSYRDALAVALQREGFLVETAADGAEAIARFDAAKPALVLLDLMLPKISGIDVCRELRTRSRVPIIMVTARNAEIDAVVGLEIGADDYVTKPFRLRELIARVRAALRRGVVEEDDLDRPDVLEIGDVRLDAGRHEVFVRNSPIALPLKEFELLELLMANAGRVLTRDVLIDRIWGPNYFGDTKTLDVHIKRLRSKIELDPANPARIVTVRGVGYRYERAPVAV
jgi:two-component system response regulator RegX3